MKDLIKKLFSEVAIYKMLLSRCFLILQILIYVLTYVTKISLIIPSFIILGISYVVYLFTKDLNNKTKTKAKQTEIFGYSLAVACSELFTGLMFKNKLMSLSASVISLTIFFTLAILIALLFHAKGTAETRARILEKDFYEKRLSNGMKPGDAQIGVSVETGEPVILPYKDRFLHMFVSGPTGSGKTSLALAPMIYEDIKNHEVGVICMEPKGDLAEKVWAMAKLEGRKNPVYFNPTLKDCPYFNPLLGPEDDVIENIVTAFASIDEETQSYFKNLNEVTLRKGVRLLKRLHGDDANLAELNMLLNNVNNIGKAWCNELSKLPVTNGLEKAQNEEIVSWFLNDYFTGISGDRGATHTFEQASGVRNQLTKLISNNYLNRVLNPPKTSELKPGDYIDFSSALETGQVISISTALGELRDIGSYLGYFLILNFQSAVFKRPGNENTRRGVFFYLDEFQRYATKAFSQFLEMARSYRLSCILATQTRDLVASGIKGNDGNIFLQNVSTNARNVILFPGGNSKDAKYYSEQFGEEYVEVQSSSISRPRNTPRFFNWNKENESISTRDEKRARILSKDIVYQKFGRAIVSLIKNNDLQEPQIVQFSWLPQELNEKIQSMVDELMKEQKVEISNYKCPEHLIVGVANDDDDDWDVSLSDINHDEIEKTKNAINDRINYKAKRNNVIDVLGEEDDDIIGL